MIRKITTSLVWIIIICFMVYGQESSQVGTSMANFLKIGAGARATAFGDAYVAIASDASATYWNPGGLGFLGSIEALFQSTSWIADTDLYFFSIGLPVGNWGTFGASVYAFTSGDIEETTLLQPEGTGRSVSASDISIGVSYARQLTDRFSAGMTIKYIKEQLSRESASTLAFDVGSIFITNFLHEMRIGISMSNLAGKMRLDGPDLIRSHDLAPDLPTNKYVDASLSTQDWDIPLTFRIGVATDMFKTEKSSLTIAAAINDSRDYELRYNYGAEYGFEVTRDQKVFARVGYKDNYDEEGLTAGGGLLINLVGYKFRVDYAYVDTGRLGNSHRYSLGIVF